MTKLDNVVKRLQLKIFAEAHRDPKSKEIPIYQNVIQMINEELTEDYLYESSQLTEERLAHKSPIIGPSP